MKEKIRNLFIEKFSKEPSIFRSPGRVNILGEHTDYNEGFVLPAAIDKYIYLAISKRNDDSVNLYAADFNENYSTDINHIKRSGTQWANYLLGVVDQLQQKGFTISGFDAVIDGNIPIGAGLSSSAAVECATIIALNSIFNLGLARIEMAAMAQKAEHTYAGVNCGIMDQFASMFGKAGHAIKLDCRSLEYEYVPLKLDGYRIVLLNTNVKHNLASSEYNIRRQQCEYGVSLIAAHHPEIKSLRDATLEQLRKYVEPVDPLTYQRCKYVVEENNRLLEACKDLQEGNIKSLGEKMFRTHNGLSYFYQVSCKELDFLVAYVSKLPYVAGARMMGGGFGGCTINLVEEDRVEELISQISKAYEQEMNLPLTAYIAITGNGSEACN